MAVTIQILVTQRHRAESHLHVGGFGILTGAQLQEHLDAVGKQTGDHQIEVPIGIHIRLGHGTQREPRLNVLPVRKGSLSLVPKHGHVTIRRPPTRLAPRQRDVGQPIFVEIRQRDAGREQATPVLLFDVLDQRELALPVVQQHRPAEWRIMSESPAVDHDHVQIVIPVHVTEREKRRALPRGIRHGIVEKPIALTQQDDDAVGSGLGHG